MLQSITMIQQQQQDDRLTPSSTPLPTSNYNEADLGIIESIILDPSPTTSALTTTTPVTTSTAAAPTTTAAANKFCLRTKKRILSEENTSGEFFSLKNIIQNLNNEIKILKEQLAEAHSSNFIKNLTANNTNTHNNHKNDKNNDINTSFLSKNSFEPLIQEIEENETMYYDQSVNDIDNENGNTFETVKKQIKNKNTITKPIVNKQSHNNNNNNNINKNNNTGRNNFPLNNSNTNNNNNNTKNNNSNTNNNNNPSTSTTDDSVTISKPKNNRRPPPLHIFGQDIKNTVALAKGIKIENFQIKRVNSNKHTVTTDTLENYNNFKTVFDEVKTKFYTFTPKELKLKSLVLRGLTENEDLEELKTDIETDNIKITKIIQMRSRRTDNNKKLLPLYIVQFTPDTKLNYVYEIKVINYQKVSWQILNKTDAIIQCKNCQRYGHTASNCKLEFRCVKCASEHLPGECTITDEITKDAIFCINCKQTGHPASYKGCPLYQNMLAKLRKRIDEKKQNAKTMPKLFDSVKVSKENGTFAEMMGGGPSLPKTKQQTQQQQHNNETTILNLTARIDKMAKIMDAQSEQISQLLQIIPNYKFTKPKLISQTTTKLSVKI